MLKADDERRHYHRMMIDSPVQITDTKQNITVLCRDLSASGMALHMPEQYFSLDDQVSIFLPTGSSQVAPLQAEAKVTRVDHCGDDYQLGVEFITLN